jgi:hypothetical protein
MTREDARRTRGLIIMEEPLNKILCGRKTAEIRSRRTNIRGPVALIQSGSGMVVGTCCIIDSIGPMTLKERRAIARRAGYRLGSIPAPGSHAWILKDARRLKKAVPYTHPNGAIIWVKLDAKVARQLPRSR